MRKPKFLACDCGCGKWFKTEETIKRHRLKSLSAKKPDVPPKNPEKRLLSEDFQPAKNAAKNVVTPIDLNGELRTMSEEINPKKSEDKKYHCGNCQTKFNEIPSYCPGCGAKLK